ncbi:L-serine dehydratase, alpha chain [subsurface metagenome]
MGKRVSIMLESVEKGITSHIDGMKTLPSSASKLSHASKRNALYSNSHNTLAAIRAMAAMEVASSGGFVCAAPTGGSSGVIPAVLYTLHHDFQITRDKLIYCAFAAGGIGLIQAIRSTFAAEVAGCQVEIGIAGAMAAAAVCESAGASSRMSMDAASICLQNTMGSVCDLVAGFCEIPCHTRNAVAASNAFVCCDLVLGGYTNHITLDDSIDASDSSGKMLPPELRCTALGGIAVTPSAKKLYNEEKE